MGRSWSVNLLLIMCDPAVSRSVHEIHNRWQMRDWCILNEKTRHAIELNVIAGFYSRFA